MMPHTFAFGKTSTVILTQDMGLSMFPVTNDGVLSTLERYGSKGTNPVYTNLTNCFLKIASLVYGNFQIGDQSVLTCVRLWKDSSYTGQCTL